MPFGDDTNTIDTCSPTAYVVLYNYSYGRFIVVAHGPFFVPATE
jgi:hypothetical protein